jgi:histidinol-phosphatase
MAVDADVAFALALADLADSISLRRFRASDLVVETKPDLTPVTEADRAVEEALRARIAELRPGEAVVGEEFGADGGGSTRWIIDPIDGTKNYARGVPVWGTLIALERNGAVVLGVASAPALGHRWWAARGAGAFADGSRMRVSGVSELGDATMSYTSLSWYAKREIPPGFLELARRCWRSRGFGDFWQHMLVADGSIEIAIDPEVAVWDVAAVQVIVEESGGRFSDLDGAPRADGGSGLSSNGLLHDEVLALLAEKLLGPEDD